MPSPAPRRAGAPSATEEAATGRLRRAADVVATIRDAGARAVAGDRPLVVAVLAVLVLALATLSGPLQHFLDARERVDSLEAKAAALAVVNSELEQRTEDLTDQEHIELLAREQHGLIRPGETPYVIVPPETDRPRIAPPVEATAPDPPWYRRIWRAVSSVLR